MKVARVLACIMLTCAAPALAAPVPYALQPEASRVGFSAPAEGATITGQFPIRSARVVLDFEKPSLSQIGVLLSVAGVRANSPFATEAMRGESVLDARHFPEARFESTAISGDASAVVVKGKLTLRGVTRPMVLHGRILRQRGAQQDDLSRLTVALTGQMRRSDFGADGWADMVGDVIALDIRARIIRTGN